MLALLRDLLHPNGGMARYPQHDGLMLPMRPGLELQQWLLLPQGQLWERLLVQAFHHMQSKRLQAEARFQEALRFFSLTFTIFSFQWVPYESSKLTLS